MTQHQAFIEQGWREAGMTSLFVARIRDGGARVEVGSFLVDQWCLGIKDAFCLDDTADARMERADRGTPAGEFPRDV